MTYKRRRINEELWTIDVYTSAPRNINPAFNFVFFQSIVMLRDYNDLNKLLKNYVGRVLLKQCLMTVNHVRHFLLT